jgi:hypothetical protein
MALEWDFTVPTLPGVTFEGSPCSFGTHRDSFTVPCTRMASYVSEGLPWCDDHGPGVADPVGGQPAPFRPIPGSIGEAMVYCIGCGEPTTLDAALSHECDLPPAGRL